MSTLKTDCQSDHLCLEAFTPAERQAILDHKYFMGIDLGFDPGIVAALESWMNNHADAWRKSRMQQDCSSQIELISTHRSEMVQQTGHEVGIEQAARDWICNCAADWRKNRDDM